MESRPSNPQSSISHSAFRIPHFFIPHSALDWAWALAGLHLAVAAWEYHRGLRFSIDPPRAAWDYFWQVIPIADLLGHPWQSFWALHAQPPGFSLWGWLWLTLGGLSHFPASLQFGYVLLGAAVVALTYRLARVLLGSSGWALAAGLGMALNPALLYYEAYLLYEPLVLFLVTASAWCLWRAWDRRSGGWLAAFAASLNALVLTRSLFHLVFLAAALAFAWPLWRAMRPGRRWALLALALLAPVAWSAKNAAQYGFFGASSWQGLGLYKCVTTAYTGKELAALGRSGLIPAVVAENYAFQAEPRIYARYGYTRQTSVPLLAREDFHNINVPAISRAYGQAARRLILRDPWRYLKAIHLSYENFCQPPSRFYQLNAQRTHLAAPETFVGDWLYGAAVTDVLQIPTRIDLGSLFYFYFPLLMAGGAWWAWKMRNAECGMRNEKLRIADYGLRNEEMRNAECGMWNEKLRIADCGLRNVTPTPDDGQATGRAALLAYFVFVCFYVAAVGCAMENGENMRFRFAIEPLTLILALAGLRMGWRRWLRPAAARFRLK